MAWLSPAYPVGAFSYSSGIEWAVESGDIKDAETLQRWLDGDHRGGRRILRCGVLRARASRGGERTTTRRCATLPSLPPPSRPRRSATWKRPRRAAPSSRRRAPHGRAPRSTGWPRSGTARSPIRSRSASRRPATASRSSPRSPPICTRSTANLISAGVRLVPLGQTDGQRVLAAFEPVVAATAARALGNAARRGRRRGHFAPISPACGTRRSTRGCSGRDMRRA